MILKLPVLVGPSFMMDRDYMAPPKTGKLVKMDEALIINPPEGLEFGYVPIVTKQDRN